MALDVHNGIYFIFAFWNQFINPLKFTFETNFNRKFIFKIDCLLSVLTFLYKENFPSTSTYEVRMDIKALKNEEKQHLKPEH